MHRRGATPVVRALPGLGGARRGAHRLARAQGKLNGCLHMCVYVYTAVGRSASRLDRNGPLTPNPPPPTTGGRRQGGQPAGALPALPPLFARAGRQRGGGRHARGHDCGFIPDAGAWGGCFSNQYVYMGSPPSWLWFWSTATAGIYIYVYMELSLTRKHKTPSHYFVLNSGAPPGHAGGAHGRRGRQEDLGHG